MITQFEVYDRLSTLWKKKETGRVYVYCEDKSEGISVTSITVKEGEIMNIDDRRGKNGMPVRDFWDLDIRSVTFIASSIPENTIKNPNALDMPQLLNRIRGALGRAGDAVALNDQSTGALWALSRKIDRIIARKGLDVGMTRGEIGLRAGVLMNFDENTPDDIIKINGIKMAVREILGEEL